MSRYQCTVPGCFRFYSTSFTLRRHIETIHLRIHSYTCSLCPRSFAYKHSLKEHVQRHYRDTQGGGKASVSEVRVTGETLQPIERGRQRRVLLPSIESLDGSK